MYATLSKGGSAASNLILSLLSTNPSFLHLSKSQGDDIKIRDREDGDLLQLGINSSLQSGALTPLKKEVEYLRVCVDGKSPEQVAGEILKDVNGKDKGGGEGKGKVIVIVGLSGVGKGTAVDILRDQLISARDGESSKVQTWSNGNIFRSLTLLTSLYMIKAKVEHQSIEEVVTPALKLEFMTKLKFEKNKHDVYDTHIQCKATELDAWVSDIQNTTLKGPLVSGKIPTVAKLCQGEVIQFAKGAIEMLSSDGGIDVIVEGRSQTLDYIDSEMRYELVLNDDSVVGKRRAAQLVSAAAVKVMSGGVVGNEEVKRIVESEVEKLVSI